MISKLFKDFQELQRMNYKPDQDALVSNTRPSSTEDYSLGVAWIDRSQDLVVTAEQVKWDEHWVLKTQAIIKSVRIAATVIGQRAPACVTSMQCGEGGESFKVVSRKPT